VVSAVCTLYLLSASLQCAAAVPVITKGTHGIMSNSRIVSTVPDLNAEYT